LYTGSGAGDGGEAGRWRCLLGHAVTRDVLVGGSGEVSSFEVDTSHCGPVGSVWRMWRRGWW